MHHKQQHRKLERNTISQTGVENPLALLVYRARDAHVPNRLRLTYPERRIALLAKCNPILQRQQLRVTGDELGWRRTGDHWHRTKPQDLLPLSHRRPRSNLNQRVLAASLNYHLWPGGDYFGSSSSSNCRRREEAPQQALSTFMNLREAERGEAGHRIRLALTKRLAIRVERSRRTPQGTEVKVLPNLMFTLRI